MTDGGALGFILFLLFIGSVLYFLPSLIAGDRRHHNLGAIVVVNLFLGWTLVGWVAALAMALTPVRPELGHTAPVSAINCPFCAETIKAEARVCRYCGRDLPVLATAPAEAPAAADWRTKEPCPHCGTGVSLAATRCPNCHSDLDADPAWRRRRAQA